MSNTSTQTIENDDEDHCPAASSGKHDPRLDGATWDRHSRSVIAETVCSRCGALGYAVVAVTIDDVDEIRWTLAGAV